MDNATTDSHDTLTSWTLKLGFMYHALFMKLERQHDLNIKPRPKSKHKQHDKITVMLVEQTEPYIVAQPEGYDAPATFFLCINKTKAHNTWSAGYTDFQTGRTLLGINNCESLDEVAIRMNARVKRYLKKYQLQPPRTLHDLPNRYTVGNANLNEGRSMAEAEKTANDTASESKPDATPGQNLQEQIRQTDAAISAVTAIAGTLKPPVVQEVVLAQRHLEDANNRLKRAYNLLPDDQK